MNNYKLCYVKDNFAWFTTAELKDQWGDDWSDAPYDCRADEPYEWREGRECPLYKLVKVAFDCEDMQTPDDVSFKTPFYSVEMINAGAVAWMSSAAHVSDKISIHAGASVKEFISKIKEAHGEVYMRKEDWDLID